MDGELRQAVLDVAARAAVLREAMVVEVEALRAAAVGERLVSRDAEGLLSAMPLAARRSPQRVGRWLDDGKHRFANRVLLDADGRPLVHERIDDGYVLAFWRYDDDRTEEVLHRGGEPHVTWVLPAGAVGADLISRWAERWTWRAGQVVRVDRGSAAPRGWPSAHAAEAELDADGAVAVIRYGGEERDYREDNRLGEDEWLDALGEALERAAGLVCDRVGWIAALDVPAELRADVAGMGERLAAMLADAIAAAAAASGVQAPFCAHVSGGPDDRPLPPRVLLPEERWRGGMVAMSLHDGAAISELWRGVESGMVGEHDLVLGDAALRACAELNGALSHHADRAERTRARQVMAELADALAARLGEPGRLHGATPDFLPLVRFGDDRGDAALERAERMLGRARKTAFTEAMRSRAPGRDGVDAGLRRRALTDRGALAQVLAAFGLRAHAERLAHEVSEVGLLLRRGGGPSRLGGPPLLPPGAGWPTGPHDRPLTFLAGVDLAQLPAGQGRPDAGWWLFFADLGEDEDGWGFYEPERNEEGARARLLPVPPGIEPVEVRPPERGLRHRAVDFEPVLALPVAESLGLDPFETEAYEAVQDALGEPSWMGGQHWVGGHVSNAQGEVPEPGTVLLLHLADDERLGFSFLDGGTIQFRVPADALARGDYAAVVAEPSSS